MKKPIYLFFCISLLFLINIVAAPKAKAVLCGAGWLPGTISAEVNIARSNIDSNKLYLNISGDIKNGSCAQECLLSSIGGNGKWAVADPIESMDYRFDSSGSWITLMKGRINSWKLVSPASPASPNCVSSNTFSEQYSSYLYEILVSNLDISSLGLTPGEHIINFKATYEPGKYFFKDINVNIPAVPVASANISADPTNVNSGQSSILTWTSSNVVSCAASAVPANNQWSGSVSISGSRTINNLTTNTSFSISCSANGQAVSSQVSVSVVPSPTPTTSPSPTVSISPTPPVGPNSIIVNSTLDDREWTGNIDYAVIGPQSIYASSTPQAFSDVQPGIYTISYLGGGPVGYKYLGISPASSLWVGEGQTLHFTLQFGTAQICDIQVSETCGGASYSGNVSYYLYGPSTFSGNYAPYIFQDVPVGMYYIAYVAGGPGTLQNVSPVNPQYCFPGQTTSFNMNFKDCGVTHTDCNPNNQCVSIPGPGSNFCSTDADCSGICDPSHPVKAGILCWGTKSSDPAACVGRIDPENRNNPSVILYLNSKGNKCVESCLWQVFDANTGQWKQDQKSCAPLPWYDQLGSYRAVLKIIDKQGRSDSVEKTFKVVDIDALACDFSLDPVAPKSVSPVNFFDRSQTLKNTTVTTWNWTFEDAAPASSKLQNPTGVLFNTIGEKTVQLTVTNSAGQQDTCSKKIQVRKLTPHWKEIIP